MAGRSIVVGGVAAKSVLRGLDLIAENASSQQLPTGSGQWYAIQTRSRHEKRVAEQLRARSIESFLPVHRCRHKWRNGVLADLELPLFPGYLFARPAIGERNLLLQLPGIIGFAASTAHPTPVPDDDIDALRKIAGSLGAEPHPFLNVGDRVRIVAGPLSGWEGILIRRKQELRLVLSIQIIMRSISVEVSELDIEPVLTDRRRIV
jgi:transcription antitermination factor NusG